MGNLKYVQFKLDALLFALHTPREVPSKVNKELDRMEAMEVISKVEETSP